MSKRWDYVVIDEAHDFPNGMPILSRDERLLAKREREALNAYLSADEAQAAEAWLVYLEATRRGVCPRCGLTDAQLRKAWGGKEADLIVLDEAAAADEGGEGRKP